MPRYISLIMALVLTVTAQVAPATVLLQAPSAPAADFRAMLRADSGLVSPVRAYRKVRPLKESREKLLSAFAKAQADFLGASTATAAISFDAVTKLLTEDDWSAEERAFILTAYLRLAQLETEPAKRDQWLLRSFAAGSDVSPDASLFPPPLLQRRLELARSLVEARRAPGFADWNVILINGKACTPSYCGKWPGDVDLRVTFLSDRWIAQTFTVQSSQVAKLKPRTVAWAEGDCKSPASSPAAQKAFGDTKVFWSLECEGDSPRELKLAPSAAPAGDIPVLAETKASRPLYKSPWLWAGVGVVAAIVIVSAAQQKKSTEATTTYGFQ